MSYNNSNQRGAKSYLAAAPPSAGKSIMAAQPIPPRGRKAFPAPVQVPGINKKETMGDVEMEVGDATKKNVGLPRNVQDGGSVQKRLSKSAIKKKKNPMIKRLVAPKSPLMVLNEMVSSETGGPVVYLFPESPKSEDPHVPPMYVAHAMHNGETFTGSGPNKIIAKNICAEQIIQSIVTNKCNQNQAKEAVGDEEANGSSKMEDETPWASLASLAIYKLFNDWQVQGFVVPPELMSLGQMMPRGPPGPPHPAQVDFTSEAGTFHDFTQTGTFQMSPCKQMPANPTGKHPVQLLNELRGTITYELAEAGESPNCTFTMTCDVEGKPYSGKGKSKKDAKKQAAIEALKEVYNINY